MVGMEADQPLLSLALTILIDEPLTKLLHHLKGETGIGIAERVRARSLPSPRAPVSVAPRTSGQQPATSLAQNATIRSYPLSGDLGPILPRSDPTHHPIYNQDTTPTALQSP